MGINDHEIALNNELLDLLLLLIIYIYLAEHVELFSIKSSISNTLFIYIPYWGGDYKKINIISREYASNKKHKRDRN